MGGGGGGKAGVARKRQRLVPPPHPPPAGTPPPPHTPHGRPPHGAVAGSVGPRGSRRGGRDGGASAPPPPALALRPPVASSGLGASLPPGGARGEGGWRWAAPFVTVVSSSPGRIPPPPPFPTIAVSTPPPRDPSLRISLPIGPPLLCYFLYAAANGHARPTALHPALRLQPLPRATTPHRSRLCRAARSRTRPLAPCQGLVRHSPTPPPPPQPQSVDRRRTHPPRLPSAHPPGTTVTVSRHRALAEGAVTAATAAAVPRARWTPLDWLCHVLFSRHQTPAVPRGARPSAYKHGWRASHRPRTTICTYCRNVCVCQWKTGGARRRDETVAAGRWTGERYAHTHPSAKGSSLLQPPPAFATASNDDCPQPPQRWSAAATEKQKKKRREGVGGKKSSRRYDRQVPSPPPPPPLPAQLSSQPLPQEPVHNLHVLHVGRVVRGDRGHGGRVGEAPDGARGDRLGRR